MARDAGGRDPIAPAGGDETRIAAARNGLLKRGAVMHTTMALNRPVYTETRAGNPFVTRWEGTIKFTDGQQVGLDDRANHWKVARGLLDLVTPAPSRDSAVRNWYRASCAELLHKLQLHGDHFEQALRLFPDDPLILTLGGSFHEALSSDGVQAFLRSAALPRGVDLRVGSARAELSRAEPLYRRAITIDPRAAEARVRLARVLSLQGRHDDALTEVRRLDASTPAMLQYFGALFAGYAAESLNQLHDARPEYERAADLYPKAQAPRFALSQLAMRSGDPSRAREAIERVLSGASDAALEDDPFWSYHVAAGRDADALMAEAYRTLFAETVP
jgi:tetratricopeptide (TPR) repeat protein